MTLRLVPDILHRFHAAAALVVRGPEFAPRHQAQESVHHIRREQRAGDFPDDGYRLFKVHASFLLTTVCLSRSSAPPFSSPPPVCPGSILRADSRRLFFSPRDVFRIIQKMERGCQRFPPGFRPFRNAAAATFRKRRPPPAPLVTAAVSSG